VTGVRPAASLYAVVRSDWACSATASAACWVPLTTCPGGKPVTALPGLTPKSPEMSDGPVLVTVVPANTAKLLAVPNPTGGWAANAGDVPANPQTTTMAAVVPTASTAAANPRRRSPVRATRADVTILLALLRYLVLKTSNTVHA
jgi:hypothetical protein